MMIVEGSTNALLLLVLERYSPKAIDLGMILLVSGTFPPVCLWAPSD